MKNLIFILIVVFANTLYAQQDITRLTELQKIFFVSETASMAATSLNPAGMSMRRNNNGVIIGYDFDEFSNQGNSSVFLSTDNFGISYQDVYNINNIRLLNYSINLSIGNEFISVGTSNRYTIAKYASYDLDLFNLDAGIILRPASFLSIGLLARNLTEVKFDSLNYLRNYTAGFSLMFFDQTLNLYADVDFKDNSKIDDLAGTVGLVISPLNLFEFRGGVILNPDNILDLRSSVPRLVDLKYEAFVSASFLIKNTIRVTAGTRFNDAGERTRYSVVFGFPLSKSMP
ncbi:MAG: hypothetical protein IT276_11060 [Ignavibacteriaceae bacterium]|nr:hypothetical protein [Ignavibacteriaceae bacterium]HMN25478.1 hypothetical protein [Ignavibacteriaceae bacterium]HRN24926.1 hypothetical protein [Ignavibacteriaceae bacterium]HRP93058.1 hypothetical protein [Ignavibacteriaceae bacterium]HRQ52694.1 hypothetical protein [Ignavibacteriaceae bacterium]